MMRIINLTCLVFLLILYSCNNSRREKYGSEKIKKQVLNLSSSYVRQNLLQVEQSILKDGSIKICKDKISYIIKPDQIVIGQINGDHTEDAALSINLYWGNFWDKTENLIFLNTNGQLHLTKVVDEHMKIIRIKDGIIFAEVPRFPGDSPTADCHICRDTLKYIFLDDKLIQVK